MARTRTASVRPPPARAPQSVDARPKNRLLATLPDADFRRILPHLKTIPVRPKQVLHSVGEPLQDVYFPNGGVFSITTMLPDGTIVEAATVAMKACSASKRSWATIRSHRATR
jgi:hypothetical protein